MKPALKILAAASLLAFIALGWSMIRVSAPTFDEPVHLASGYTALLNGSRLLNGLNHPPFAEMWAALPLLVLKPASFFQHPFWLGGRIYNYADLFLYKNTVPAERLLDHARFFCLVTWALAFGASILSWSWRLAGAPGLTAAAILFAFCPPLFSNAALVATDAASAALFFLTFFLLAWEKRGPAVWLAAGLCMGLALASKYNMLVLPAFVAVFLASEWNLDRKQPLPWAWFLVSAGVALAALAAVHRFNLLPVYFAGLSATVSRLNEGRSTFLYGQYSTTGHPLYFPVALLIKTPLPLLAAAAAGLMSWPLWQPGLAPRAALKRAMWVLAPPAAYFLLACFSKTQIGYRHILPVYPFLVVAGACGAAWAWRSRWGRAACLGGSLWLVASVGAAFPHYLAYFNEAVGGPAGGWRWLVDSNLDWGQDLKGLAVEVRRRGNPVVYLSYFGVADPSYYGLRYVPLLYPSLVERREGVAHPAEGDPLLVAVSATNLQGNYFADHAIFDWLKARQPVHRAGQSIFLYDLTGDAEGARRLASLLERAGDPGAARRILVRYQP